MKITKPTKVFWSFPSWWYTPWCPDYYLRRSDFKRTEVFCITAVSPLTKETHNDLLMHSVLSHDKYTLSIQKKYKKKTNTEADAIWKAWVNKLFPFQVISIAHLKAWIRGMRWADDSLHDYSNSNQMKWSDIQMRNCALLCFGSLYPVFLIPFPNKYIKAG